MNNLLITCDDPDAVLAGFGANARIKLQSAATQAGAMSSLKR